MTTVNQRSRQERALEQRRAELKAWQGPEEQHPRVSSTTSNRDLRVEPQKKINTAVSDIENLKGKLGIRTPVDQVG